MKKIFQSRDQLSSGGATYHILHSTSTDAARHISVCTFFLGLNYVECLPYEPLINDLLLQKNVLKRACSLRESHSYRKIYQFLGIKLET